MILEGPMRSHAPLALLLACTLAAPGAAAPPARTAAPAMRITILHDASGATPSLPPDWGFAALIEYGELRILFDTGNDAAVFERNVRTLGIDLGRLDFVIMSHRHGDHIAGLPVVLRKNPQVRVYAPRENFGVFGSSLPATFYRRDTSLPGEMRYFGGRPGEELQFGSAWPEARFVLIDTLTELSASPSCPPSRALPARWRFASCRSRSARRRARCSSSVARLRASRPSRAPRAPARPRSRWSWADCIS
jgi:hypothetical protein